MGMPGHNMNGAEGGREGGREEEGDFAGFFQRYIGEGGGEAELPLGVAAHGEPARGGEGREGGRKGWIRREGGREGGREKSSIRTLSPPPWS